jgi:hypothetical protein
LNLPNWPDGEYAVMWYDTDSTRVIEQVLAESAGGSLELNLPTFRNDMAVTVSPPPPMH